MQIACVAPGLKKNNIDGQPETLSSISVKKFQFSAHKKRYIFLDIITFCHPIRLNMTFKFFRQCTSNIVA